MMNELVAFYEARLDQREKDARDAHEDGHVWVQGWGDADHGEYAVWQTSGLDRPDRCGEHPAGLPNQCDDAIVAVFDDFHGVATLANARHVVYAQPAAVLADIAAERKLVARYKAAVESHKEALQRLQEVRKAGADPDQFHAADADVAAASARAGAFLTVLEDRAARFSDHPDYQDQWRRP